MKQKPMLSFWQIWNMCFGFLGIQMGFALQNANVSRIFQTLGADVENLAVYWVAAPLTGLIVQPIIGYMSDRTWNRFGRRRPYFTVGAVLATLALFVMPNSPALWFAVGMLWIMDASINISMEPFRAFVGDMLPENQRTSAFSMQTFFIGVGAVVGSALPWMMTNLFNISNTAGENEIPPSLKAAFYVGGAMFLIAVMWTVIRTKEYSPEELEAFDKARPPEHVAADTATRSVAQYQNWGIATALIGAVSWYLILQFGLDKQLFILAGAFIAFGLLQIVVSAMKRRGNTSNGVYEVVHDLFHMPRVMRQLAVVQFFAWFALFCMWVYGTPAVTSYFFETAPGDTSSVAYNTGADWVGLLFGAYNGVAAFAAMAIPFLAARFGCRMTHLVNMCIGGIAILSFFFIKDMQLSFTWGGEQVILQDYHLLMCSMIGVGIAWASILSLPYALLSSNLPSNKMGVYMGIFNFFIVIPQITVAGILGPILKQFFDSRAIFAFVIGGILMILSGLATLLVDKEAEPQ